MNLRPLKGIIILIVTAMSLSSCNWQYSLLYYPSAFLPSEKELAANRIRFWPSGPAGYRGFIGSAGIDAKGTIVVFHGNAGTASDRAYYVAALAALGYRVLLAEYPGYGGRKGELGEESLVKDAQATIRLAARSYGGPVFLLGESLGCGVAAAAVADRTLRIDGILLITPWDTLLAVAKAQFPWLPVGWFMKDRYDNIENLKSFPGRIAVVGAQRDEIVPIRHAEALFRSLTGVKKMWTIPGVGHNDWLRAVDTGKWREFVDFVSGDARR